MQPDEKKLIQKFLSDDISPVNGLDIGCGPRVKRGGNCDGQEFIGKLLSIDKNKDFEPDLCCNVLELKKHFKQGSMKFVTLVHTLEDLENPYEAIRQIVQTLGKDGIMAIICPYRGKYHRIGTEYANGGHKYDFEPWDVAYMVWRCCVKKKSNYEVLSYDTLNNNYSFELVIRKKFARFDYSYWPGTKFCNDKE